MMRAAVRWAAPMPSPSRMMMFFAGRPSRPIATTSKLPSALTLWPSLCVARTVSLWTPGRATENARCETTAAFTSFGSVRPVVTTLVVPGDGCVGAPSTRKLKSFSVVPASRRTVACRSKRWPGRKRAMYGPATLPLANSSLGGVSRLTVGAAPASAAATTIRQAATAEGTLRNVDMETTGGWMESLVGSTRAPNLVGAQADERGAAVGFGLTADFEPAGDAHCASAGGDRRADARVGRMQVGDGCWQVVGQALVLVVEHHRGRRENREGRGRIVMDACDEAAQFDPCAGQRNQSRIRFETARADRVSVEVGKCKPRRGFDRCGGRGRGAQRRQHGGADADGGTGEQASFHPAQFSGRRMSAP